jgi:heme o synthase
MIQAAEQKSFEVKESEGQQGAFCALFTLAKPGIVAAVTLSGFTGMVVAGRGLPEVATAVSCLTSLFLMAAGSAIINCVMDRRMDEQMERVSARSAALRRIGTAQALATATLLTTAAVALSSSLLNSRVALLLLAASLSYTLYYTLFLKRHTPWAALLGGLPGAFPVLIGHAAISAHPGRGSLALFLIMLIWQPPHFWLLSLAHQQEYRAAGVPVLPLVQGGRFTRRCIFLGVAALLPAPLLLHYAGPCSPWYAACATLLGASYLFLCHKVLSGDSCKAAGYRVAFRGSIIYILMLFGLIIADLSL